MVDYSFTITLKPVMYKKDIDWQYDETCNELVIALRSISNNFTLVCELTQSMNVHYHGIIELGTSKRKFVNLFRNDKKFGFISCKEITNREGWVNYLRKDLKNSMEELGRRVIINDDHKIFMHEEMRCYAKTFE